MMMFKLFKIITNRGGLSLAIGLLSKDDTRAKNLSKAQLPGYSERIFH